MSKFQYEEVFKRLGPYILSQSRTMVNRENTLEDAQQRLKIAVIETINNRPEIQWDSLGHQVGWAYNVIRNTALQYRKQAAKNPLLGYSKTGSMDDHNCPVYPAGTVESSQDTAQYHMDANHLMTWLLANRPIGWKIMFRVIRARISPSKGLIRMFNKVSNGRGTMSKGVSHAIICTYLRIAKSTMNTALNRIASIMLDMGYTKQEVRGYTGFTASSLG